MGKIFDFVYCFTALSLFPISLIVIFNFVLFTSSQAIKIHVAIDKDVWGPVLRDFGLVVGFMFLHTFFACRLWKNILTWLGCERFERLVMIAVTVAWLQVVMNYWREVPMEPVWLFSNSDNRTLNTLFSILHITAWCILLAETWIMDLPELFGLKQLYYWSAGYSHPLTYKSAELVHLFRHMRHPGATMLTLVLWCHPVMTVSRFILALSFTLYMITGFSVTRDDFVYAKQQWSKKLL